MFIQDFFKIPFFLIYSNLVYFFCFGLMVSEDTNYSAYDTINIEEESGQINDFGNSFETYFQYGFGGTGEDDFYPTKITDNKIVLNHNFNGFECINTKLLPQYELFLLNSHIKPALFILYSCPKDFLV